jgi:hypothetical protein
MTDRELMHAIVMRLAEENNDPGAPWHFHGPQPCAWCKVWNEFKARAGYTPEDFKEAA